MSLFDLYFQYREDTEAPRIFHRWSLIGCIGAFLGRQYWFPFGTSRIFPNHYIMLIGTPGSRKSTAILNAKSILSSSGYSTFAANKTTKEKFLLDLEGAAPEVLDRNGRPVQQGTGNIVLQNLFGGDGEDTAGQDPKEMFVVADEFNEFVGSGNIEFLSLLGSLWDWDDESQFYKYRLKNSKSVHIFQPTLSILSGNTHDGFKEAFPPQAIGQGFLSRLILVYAEPSGRKITFPRKPSDSILEQIKNTFGQIREKVSGPATISVEAQRALDMVYRTWKELDDQRFKHYSTRRFTHLLKLCLICSAGRVSNRVDIQDVLLANSILTYTEGSMPKALGEFGKSRNSEAANKIMQVLYEAKAPLPLTRLWKVVQNDMEKMTDLTNLLQSLQNADKIQVVRGEKGGFLPKQRSVDTKALYCDFNLLKEFKVGN